MQLNGEIKVVEKYQPYLRSDSSIPSIRIHKSGHFSVNEAVYSKWLLGMKRVELFHIVSGQGEKGIGIKPLSDKMSGGLSLSENPKWKSKLISARGFMTRYEIPFRTKMLKAYYDQDHSMVVALLGQEKDLGGESQREYGVSSLASDEATSYEKTKSAVLEFIPFEGQGKAVTVPEIRDETAANLGYKFRRGTRKRNFYQQIIYL